MCYPVVHKDEAQSSHDDAPSHTRINTPVLICRKRKSCKILRLCVMERVLFYLVHLVHIHHHNTYLGVHVVDTTDADHKQQLCLRLHVHALLCLCLALQADEITLLYTEEIV